MKKVTAHDVEVGKERKLELLKEKLALKAGLPHLYGWKNYAWMEDFLSTTNKTAILTASNQSGKSSTQIRKVIDWATNMSLWPSLWRQTPRQFWYLYPTREVASIEFETKWKPDFMPRNEFKNHPVFGWREEKRGRGDGCGLFHSPSIAIGSHAFPSIVYRLQLRSYTTISTCSCQWFSGSKLSVKKGGENCPCVIKYLILVKFRLPVRR